MNKLQKTFLAVGVLALVYLSVLGIWHIFMVKVQYALVCEADSISNCKKVEAKYSYDSMDGRYFVYNLQLPDRAVDYGSTSCTVLPTGSKCVDSTTGAGDTGSDRVIVPLSITSYRARW